MPTFQYDSDLNNSGPCDLYGLPGHVFMAPVTSTLIWSQWPFHTNRVQCGLLQPCSCLPTPQQDTDLDARHRRLHGLFWKNQSGASNICWRNRQGVGSRSIIMFPAQLLSAEKLYSGGKCKWVKVIYYNYNINIVIIILIFTFNPAADGCLR